MWWHWWFGLVCLVKLAAWLVFAGEIVDMCLVCCLLWLKRVPCTGSIMSPIHDGLKQIVGSIHRWEFSKVCMQSIVHECDNQWFTSVLKVLHCYYLPTMFHHPYVNKIIIGMKICDIDIWDVREIGIVWRFINIVHNGILIFYLCYIHILYIIYFILKVWMTWRKKCVRKHN